ncbi:MAG: hypothetical protein LBT76_02640, partial [Tannerella sp.]|nr:hypothetical protein [Tannerella sp.]
GREVEVIVFPTREDAHQEVDLYVESQRILEQAKMADISEMDKIFETYLFSLKGFKFDRNVANDYD